MQLMSVAADYPLFFVTAYVMLVYHTPSNTLEIYYSMAKVYEVMMNGTTERAEDRRRERGEVASLHLNVFDHNFTAGSLCTQTTAAFN